MMEESERIVGATHASLLQGSNEDVAAENEESLQTLIRAITLSQGEFSLILVRCNYAHLREQIVQQLREKCPVKIHELVLDKSVKTLYTTIEQALKGEKPDALMVFGLESVEAIDQVIVATNQVREEFRKNFRFPLVLWVNDDVLKKFTRLAPDFDSWTTTIEFAIATDELLEFLQDKAEQILEYDSMIPRWICSDLTLENCAELEAACQEIQSRGYIFGVELNASIEFVRGLDNYVNNNIDAALEHYKRSLDIWQEMYRRDDVCVAPTSGLERQGKLLLSIGQCYYRKAVQDRAKSQQYWEESKYYLQQGIAVFEQAKRFDLVACHISKLCEIVRLLQDWEQLQVLAQKSLGLHETYNNPSQLAQDYGCLAEIALEKSRWSEAIQLARKALQILSTFSNKPEDEASLYWFILGRSQEHLGQLEEALVSIEKARTENNHQYDPQLYIDILKKLRSLYFQQGEYLKAFEVKQEQQSIEAQYGFRPFTGAGSLRSVKRVINPTLDLVDPQVRARERMTAKGRRSDLNTLIQRLSRNDYKLIVIHGMSGVGKSSLIWAGLVPELKQNPIGDRNALPVTLRYYTNWARELGNELAEELREMGIEETVLSPRLDPPQPPFLRGENSVKVPLKKGDLGGSPGLKARPRLDPPQPPFLRGEQEEQSYTVETIIERLKKNADRNLLTVLIFDQFEEFFFACTNLVERRPFYEFLKTCLNLPYVKVVMSLREDYLHYLLECDRFANLDVINSNILDKNIRLYLGDFSPERAKAVILELTERSQFYLEPGLIDELVRDLAGELGEIRPIELQVVGAQLQTENITTLEQYHQLGANPKEKLVQRSLEEVIKDCGAENERAARLVLYLLTNENGTRPLKTRAELEADLKVLGFETEAEQLDLVLEILVGSGLVFLVPDSPANRYQLVHDYLVAFIRQQQAPGLLAELAEAKEKQKLTEAQLRQALREKEEALRKEQEERKRTEIAEIEALNSLSQALLPHDQLGALLASVKAGKKLHKSELPSELNTRTVGRLWQAVYSVQERNRFQGHSSAVKSVSFSPDGQTLASGSDNGIVKLWGKDGTEIQTFQGHSDEVWSVAWSPDGQILASASLDSTVKLWRKDGKVMQTLQGHSSWVIGVAWSPDGQILASASRDRTVKLWNKDGTLLQTFQGHTGWVTAVAWSPDGQTLASVSRDRTIKLWRKDGTEIQTFQGHGGEVWSVAWSPDGQMVVSASHDRKVKLWRKDGTLLQTFSGHSERVVGVAWSPSGQIIASASLDHTVKLWRKDGTVVRTFQGHSNSVYSVSFSPDGQILASASRDRTVKLWCLHETTIQILQGHKGWVNSISFSPDGQMLASASRDCTVKLWHKDGKMVRTLQGHKGWVNSISFSPDGQMLASASRDRTVKLWRLDGIVVQTFQGHSSSVYGVTWSPDSQILASASRDCTVKLWCLDSKEVKTFQGHQGWVNSISFSCDGQILASASVDHTVKLWRLDGTEIQTFYGHSAGINSIAWSPDGQIIASASTDGTVKLWRLDGTEVQTFYGHSAGVNSISFSPDGQMIASASTDGTVKLWRLDGTEVQTFYGHSAGVRSVRFSPDCQMIASASDDRTVILRNLALKELLILGCNWLRDYLKTNPNVSQSDRTLCDGIGTHN
jgi:WD40 repeat protein/tetratricopeptide (TPR) repeat protein